MLIFDLDVSVIAQTNRRDLMRESHVRHHYSRRIIMEA